jgi:hypothetical protein
MKKNSRRRQFFSDRELVVDNNIDEEYSLISENRGDTPPSQITDNDANDIRKVQGMLTQNIPRNKATFLSKQRYSSRQKTGVV